MLTTLSLFTFATKFFISLLSILNPLGALPVFISLTSKYSKEEIDNISMRCGIAIFITLMLSLICGKFILGYFGISLVSFRVAGGILIALSAMSMIRAEQSPTNINQSELDRQSQIKELGVVPLAIPLLAGPGSISTCIIQSEKFDHWYEWGTSFVALFLLSMLVFYILSSSRKIRERIGRTGMNVLTRIMGMILLAVAIEYIVAGLKGLFPALG
ncbi:MAG: MarC family protein [Bacteriovoracaceae bacterium]|nr:MarC family protein [Bacteriovoracaceae bacterium]